MTLFIWTTYQCYTFFNEVIRVQSMVKIYFLLIVRKYLTHTHTDCRYRTYLKCNTSYNLITMLLKLKIQNCGYVWNIGNTFTLRYNRKIKFLFLLVLLIVQHAFGFFLTLVVPDIVVRYIIQDIALFNSCCLFVEFFRISFLFVR